MVYVIQCGLFFFCNDLANFWPTTNTTGQNPSNFWPICLQIVMVNNDNDFGRPGEFWPPIVNFSPKQAPSFPLSVSLSHKTLGDKKKSWALMD